MVLPTIRSNSDHANTIIPFIGGVSKKKTKNKNTLELAKLE